jgi:hypothetical protein
VVTVQELVVSSLVQTDALTKLLIEKGLITRAEFMQKLLSERAMYQVALERVKLTLEKQVMRPIGKVQNARK